jgi:hypothetical protein
MKLKTKLEEKSIGCLLGETIGDNFGNQIK